MSATLSPQAPDLRLSPQRFAQVAALLGRHAGIQLREGKESLVVARLGHRVRALGLPSLEAYLDALHGATASSPELTHFVDVLTTNKTSFLREPAHFEHLRQAVLPVHAAGGGELRIWSAGCSSGEEPYTLAMLALATLTSEAAARVRILATDLSTRVLEAARRGSYAEAHLDDLPVDWRERFMEADPAHAGARRMRDAVRARVRFARLNLMEAWPMRGPFEVIFCRNVMIYFDRPTQERLVKRFAELLAPGGHLYVGHSESLSALSHGLRHVAPALYQRPHGPP